MFKYKKLKGFALFESAISLIVASSVISSYSTQQTDKQIVNDVLSYSKSSQMAVTEYYQKNGTLPTNNQEAQLPAASSFDHPSISRINIGEFGEVIITLSDSEEALSDKTIILEPRVVNNNLTWTCNDGSLENIYRPVSCYKKQATQEYFYETDEESEILDFIENANYL